jgi:hypothetical protein
MKRLLQKGNGLAFVVAVLSLHSQPNEFAGEEAQQSKTVIKKQSPHFPKLHITHTAAGPPRAMPC